MIEHLDKAIRPLVLLMSKMSGCVKTFKVKNEDKDKKDKSMSFRMDDGRFGRYGRFESW